MIEHGPWFVHHGASVRICDGKHDSEAGCSAIGEAEIIAVPRELAVARARLMAASPDLLKALCLARKVIIVACGKEAPYIRVAIASIDAAIVKGCGP